jgi:hypothetical protein
MAVRGRRGLLAIATIVALLLPALAAAQAPAPAAAPASFEQGLPPLRPEHVLAGVVGLLVGDAVLHSALGFPSAISLIAGGVAGYYVYVRYVEPGLDGGMRRASTATSAARLHLIGLQERAEQTAADAYRWLGERLAPAFCCRPR